MLLTQYNTAHKQYNQTNMISLYSVRRKKKNHVTIATYGQSIKSKCFVHEPKLRKQLHQWLRDKNLKSVKLESAGKNKKRDTKAKAAETNIAVKKSEPPPFQKVIVTA